MEFIHLFTDHKDTVHVTHKGLVIENKHHHCAFLSLTLTSFINDFDLPFIRLTSVQHFIRYADITSDFALERIESVSLRGPPTV